MNHEQPSPVDLDRHDVQQDPVPVGSEKDESWIQQARSGWCGLSEDDSRLLDNVPAALALMRCRVADLVCLTTMT